MVSVCIVNMHILLGYTYMIDIWTLNTASFTWIAKNKSSTLFMRVDMSSVEKQHRVNIHCLLFHVFLL